MFSFLKRWNNSKVAEMEDLPKLDSDEFDSLPEDDLEAVVGGLTNAEQIQRSIKQFNDVIHLPHVNKDAM